jgi:DNA-directed RNA polymerase subunit K/omega
MNAPGTVYSPEDFRNIADNIYEAILVIAKRARQVGELQKRQIDRYLGQTEMAEQAAAQARAEDSEDIAAPIEPEPVDRPEFKFEKPVIVALQEMKERKVDFYYED